MDEQPVPIYYVPCREEGCWVLFATKPPLPLCLTCRVHGHALDIESAGEGLVTEFEAHQGWTRQRPD
jgi:hypothetical protein